MAIPSVKMFSNEPGGGLVTAMGGINALHNAMLERKMNQIKSQYLPSTLQAEAASKLAYANLMGPQFVSKLLSNEGALASLPDDQKKALLNMVTRAGSNNSGANALNMPQNHSGIGQPSTNSFSGKIKDAFHSLLGQTPQSNQNAMNMPTPGNDNNPNPGTSYEGPGPINSGSPFVGRQGYKPPVAAIKRPKGAVTLEGKQGYDKNGNPVYAEEERINEPTWEENLGKFKGTVEEGKELGKIRAKTIGELDDQYQQAVQQEVPVNHLIEVTQDPLFKNMRDKIPFFQDKQLDVLSKLGTPEEQRLIGDFTTTATNAVANTVNSFKGRILDKEVTMANQMKVSPKDTWNVMVGKLASLKTFNEMTKERARIASRLMQERHINKGQAIEIADKQINGKAIRQHVENELNPISDEDIDHTAKEMGMTREQVIKRLRAEGRYNG